jgi:hypothetical protein
MSSNQHFTHLVETKIRAFCDKHRDKIEKCYVQTEGYGGLGIYPVVPNRADHDALATDFRAIGELGADPFFQCLLNDQGPIHDTGRDPVVLWERG